MFKITIQKLLLCLILDSRLPHRQTSSGESRPVYLQFNHSERRSPTGLCPESPALLSLHTRLRVKFADDTVVLGLISSNDETTYLDEVERLTSWCQDNCLSLNVSKTKELIALLMISGTPVERVSSFKYLGVNISEDLTWTTHIQTQVKKARQRLYHLQQLRKFRVSPSNPENFLFRGHRKCIDWVSYENVSSQDCKALQKVVRLAERISGSALPSLKDIYLKRCISRAAKIIKDTNRLLILLTNRLLIGNRLFILAKWWQKLRD